MRLKFQPAIIIFLIGLLLTTLTACGTDSTNNQEVVLPILQTSDPNIISPTSSELCGNVLYPTTQGAAWVYTSIGGPSGSFNYTNSITETRADGFTLTSQFTDLTRTQEWDCQPDGLKALQLGGGSAAGISIQGMTAELVTSEVTGISIPQTVTPGMQWQYTLTLQGTVAMPGNQQAQSNGAYSADMKEVGTGKLSLCQPELLKPSRYNQIQTLTSWRFSKASKSLSNLMGLRSPGTHPGSVM